MSDSNDKVVLVTGGGTGIGRGIALAFRAAGAKVVVVGRREAPLKSLAAEDDGIAYTLADVTDSAQLKAAVAFTLETFGRLDTLVNNAGVYAAKPLSETSDAELSLLLAVNLGGVLTASRDALPELAKTRGSIVNISSVVGTGVAPGLAAYSATKAGVDQLTRVLAAEVGAAGVRVNAVSPGLTRSDMAAPLIEDEASRKGMLAQTPLGRLGEPEDIAKAVVFLASDKAEWITGQVLASSGGLLL